MIADNCNNGWTKTNLSPRFPSWLNVTLSWRASLRMAGRRVWWFSPFQKTKEDYPCLGPFPRAAGRTAAVFLFGTAPMRSRLSISSPIP